MMTILFSIFLISVGILIIFIPLLKKGKPLKQVENKVIKEDKPDENFGNAQLENITKEQKNNNEKYLINSIKESNNINEIHSYFNGHIIIFSDGRKINLLYLPSFSSFHKSFSKSIEKDSISGFSFSSEKLEIYVGARNSKKILIFYLFENDGKIKIQRKDKEIICERKFELGQIASDTKGNVVASLGSNDDLEVQIFCVEERKVISSTYLKES